MFNLRTEMVVASDSHYRSKHVMWKKYLFFPVNGEEFWNLSVTPASLSNTHTYLKCVMWLVRFFEETRI